MSDPIVCRCYRVTRDEILQAIQEGDLRTVEEVTARTNAAGGCSSCYDDVRALIDGVQGSPPPEAPAAALSDAEARRRIDEVIRGFIEPLYRLNGVQMRILEVKGPRITARLAGRTVETTLPSILALKRAFVQAVSDACGRKMQLVEVNRMDPGIAES